MIKPNYHPCIFAIGNGAEVFYCNKTNKPCVCQRFCHSIGGYKASECKNFCKDYLEKNK